MEKLGMLSMVKIDSKYAINKVASFSSVNRIISPFLDIKCASFAVLLDSFASYATIVFFISFY